MDINISSKQIIVSGLVDTKNNVPEIVTKVVFQLSNSIPTKCVFNKINTYAKSWDFQYFGSDAIVKFFTDNPVDEFNKIIEIYNKTETHEQRVNIFKYYYLYVNGGVYIESENMFSENIDKIIENHGFITVDDFSTFIAAYPRNPIIYKMLKDLYNEKFQTVFVNARKFVIENTWDFTYRFYDLSKISKIETINDVSLIKMGITMDLPSDNMNMFSNGIRQNALYFYALLKNIGYDVYLIVNESAKNEALLSTLYGLDNTTLKYIDITDIDSLLTFDIVFQFVVQLNNDTIHLLREKGVKFVSYKCGNDYVIQMEDALFNAHGGVVSNADNRQLFDQVWSIPQMVNTNLHYWKTLYRCDSIEVPFIWSPLAIEQYEKKLLTENSNSTGINYKNRGTIKKLVIFEPNLNVFKWVFPAILVCENSYRSIPEKIGKVYATNITSPMSANLTQLVKPLDLFRDNKISVEGRYSTMSFMTNHADVAVSHQWENPLNYLYLDLAWMGWPIVHNAHLCKDIGYYYEGFNYEMGGQVLTEAILNHDKTADEYKRRNRRLIDRYLPTNLELQQKYKVLIDRILH